MEHGVVVLYRCDGEWDVLKVLGPFSSGDEAQEWVLQNRVPEMEIRYLVFPLERVE